MLELYGNIKKFRLEKGLSQQELAEKIGWETYIDIITQKRGRPKPPFYFLYALAFASVSAPNSPSGFSPMMV